MAKAFARGGVRPEDEATRTETTTGARFPLIESARGIAALMIVAYHVGQTMPASADMQGYVDHLALGVPVFFVISGFLLYRPFVAARLGGRPVALGSYAVRRVLRIVPAYWVALTLLVLFGNGAAEVRADPLTYYGFAQSFSDATLLEGIGVAWTLSSELIFYAALPLYALLMAFRLKSRPRWGREVAGLAVLAAAAFAYTSGVDAAVGPDNRGEWMLHVIPRYLGHFAMGMGLAVMSVWIAQRAAPPSALGPVLRRPSLAWLAVPIGFSAVVEIDAGYAVRDAIDGLVAAALLWPAIFGRPGVGFAGRVLGARPLLFAGMVSYGIYLYHYPFVTRVESYADNGQALFVMVAALSTAAGYASWRLVERPAIEWGKRRQAGVAARRQADAPLVAADQSA